MNNSIYLDIIIILYLISVSSLDLADKIKVTNIIIVIVIYSLLIKLYFVSKYCISNTERNPSGYHSSHAKWNQTGNMISIKLGLIGQNNMTIDN